MTRSADAALDEAQLKLGNACEELLASKAWQRSHPETYAGLKLRLQLLQEAGLPRMRVVPNTKLEELGRIPRSNEGHQVSRLSKSWARCQWRANRSRSSSSILIDGRGQIGARRSAKICRGARRSAMLRWRGARYLATRTTLITPR